MGVCHWDYAELIEQELDTIDAYYPTGAAYAVIANRVSHHFDFRGPSVVNDTACASSLVSVQQAVQALTSGDCDQALMRRRQPDLVAAALHRVQQGGHALPGRPRQGVRRRARTATCAVRAAASCC